MVAQIQHLNLVWLHVPSRLLLIILMASIACSSDVGLSIIASFPTFSPASGRKLAGGNKTLG